MLRAKRINFEGNDFTVKIVEEVECLDKELATTNEVEDCICLGEVEIPEGEYVETVDNFILADEWGTSLFDKGRMRKPTAADLVMMGIV